MELCVEHVMCFHTHLPMHCFIKPPFLILWVGFVFTFHSKLGLHFIYLNFNNFVRVNYNNKTKPSRVCMK